MIQMHQFLVYVLKYLAENDELENDCSVYIDLNISPHHIHRTKAEHKHAIFVLANTISNVILNKEEGSIPPNVTNALQELIKRSENDIVKAESK